MKIITFIMAFLVLALSILPCADAGATIEGKLKTEITRTTNQQDQDNTDACSPFCYCACCAGISINHASTSTTGIHIFSNTCKSSFLPSKIIEVVLPIWQPPRFC